MASSPRNNVPHSEIVTESEEEVSKTRTSRKRVSIKRPPRVPNEDEETEDMSETIRRTRTVPSQLGEPRSRRNLSRVFSDELGRGEDEILVDSKKRLSSSRKGALMKTPSERELKPSLSKKSGRAATPLDIPFAPNPAIARTVSAEASFQDLLDMEMMEQSMTTIRRTQTQIPTDSETDVSTTEATVYMDITSKPSATKIRRTRTNAPTTEMDASTSEAPLHRVSSLKLTLDSIPRQEKLESLTRMVSVKGESLTKDSAKDLEMRRMSRKGEAMARSEKSPGEETNKEHVVTIDGRSSKKVTPSRSESKKLPDKTSSRKLKTTEVQAKPVTWFQLFLHFLGLIFVQYPFKYHKQWLEKMYRAKRLQRPSSYRPMAGWEMTSGYSDSAAVHGGAALPSLPENTSGFTPRITRVRRRTQLDGDDSDDEFNTTAKIHHRKRSSRHSGQFSPLPMRPPPGHLPRSRNIPIERENRKKSRKSVEIFGDIMNALGIHTKNGRLKLPFGISDMDESELSGFQARFYKFIKRQHKGRLARAWDHIIHPLDSMQKKHRRSANKTRLLNAIDKHRAQKYESALDIVKTNTFLLGQWVFEALSPPKFTKKPMLFTVLFPLMIILFFGFMAGEYPQWKEAAGDAVSYEFGPQELSRWLFKSEKWRTFDDGFLIAWGARYLPLVTTESWRWVFSMLVHENFAHLGGNLLLFVILSWSLESKYGFFRTGLICWLSGISGNFMSAAFEDSCGIVLGASGCVFGLAAFYVVDVVGDFKFVSFPCLRLVGICAFLSAFIIALTSHQEASHLSHIGGFLCGMGLSVVLVPRFIDERLEACLPWVSLFSGILLLCAFPLVVLLSVIPNLQCTS